MPDSPHATEIEPATVTDHQPAEIEPATVTDHQPAEIERVRRLLKRHRFYPSSDPQTGFCGGPYCATGLVSIEEYEDHLTDVLVTTRPGDVIVVPKPRITTGPKHQTVDEATAAYLREAASRVCERQIWGSSVSRLVADLLSAAAEQVNRPGITGSEGDHG